MKQSRPMRVGFELEVMFLADEYTELVEAAEQRGFLLHDDCEAPHFMRAIIAKDLEEYIGEKVTAPKFIGPNPSSRWTIKPEYDVEHTNYSNTACAVEIITPPLVLNEAKDRLQDLFFFCIESGGFTDENCGLHMTFDFPEGRRSSLATLALFLDEDEILRKFNRSAHDLAVPQRHKLIVEAATAMMDGNEFALDDYFLEHSLGEGKNFAINIEKYHRYGIVEFRHCGGKNILYEVEAICQVIDDIAGAINEACTYDGDGLLRKKIEDDVEATISTFKRLELSPGPAKFLGVKRYEVALDGKQIGEICQINPADFKFFPHEGVQYSTALVVNSLSKAKALVAFSLHLSR